MIKHISLIFFILIISKMTFAQSNFVNATIIQKDNKEILGQIDYQEWKKNPRRVLFKTKNEAIKAYFPSDINGFVIIDNAERYLSAVVKLSMEFSENGKLKEYTSVIEAVNDLEFETDTLFLLTLKTGLLNLYSFTDKNSKDHYFTQKGNAPFNELTYRKVIVDNNQIKEVKEIKDYVFQFKKDVFDCAEIFDQLETLAFKLADFMNIVNLYNNCNNQNIYTKNNDKRRMGVYPIIGIDKPFSAYYVAPLKTVPITLNVKLNEKISPILGLGYDCGFKRNRSKWGVAVELIYKPIKATLTKQYQNTTFSSYMDTYTFNFEMKYLQFNTFLRYTFYLGKVQPYIKIGPGLVFISHPNNYIAILNGYNNTTKVTIIETFSRTLNFNGCLGLKKDNFFLEGRFALEANVSNQANKSLQSKYLSFIGGYSFIISK